jgi:hypothetical protein
MLCPKPTYNGTIYCRPWSIFFMIYKPRSFEHPVLFQYHGVLEHPLVFLYHRVCYSLWVNPVETIPRPRYISENCDFTRGILANLLKIMRHYLVQKSSKIWTGLSGKIYAPSYREYLVQFGVPPGLSPLSHYAERHCPLELYPVR